MINKPNQTPLPVLTSPPSQIQRPSLRGAVILQLKDAILNGDLKDGQRINEVEVAQWMGVSRGLVREAIRELESDGILSYEPYRGTFVRSWTPERVKELYSLREVLEEYAVELAAAKITESDIETLSSLVEGMRLAAQENDANRVVELDLEFHRKIYEQSGHVLLIDMLNNLSNQIYLLIRSTKCYASIFAKLEEVADTHVAVLVALLARDGKRARQEIKTHITETGDRICNFLSN
jgi:DNA-binding GntR family transcriptional regulator